jgi:amino acid efflux transporter
VALYLGAVLGAGVLVLPGTTATRAGPGSLLAWVFVGLLGVPLALTFAELARRYPDAGGVATFVRLAFGRRAGAIVGWFYFTAGSFGQAIVAFTGAYYVGAPLDTGTNATFVVAGAILAAAVAANLRGLRVSGRFQLVLAGGVGAVLLAAIVAAVPHFDLHRFDPFMPHGAGAVAASAIPLFFAFAGWEAITHLAAEFKDPDRDLVRSTAVTIALVLALYLGVSFAVIATGTYGSPELDRVAVAELLGRSLGVGAKQVAAVTAGLISLGTANAFVAATSRLGYALGRDGALPACLGRVDGRGVPSSAVVAVAAVAAAGLLLAYGWRLGAEDLLFVPSPLVVATYVIAMAAAVRLLEGRARVLAGCALVLCLGVVPVLGASSAVPLAVAAAALLYWRLRRVLLNSGRKLDSAAAFRRLPRPPRRPRLRRRPSPDESLPEELVGAPSGGFTSDAWAAERPTFSIRTSVFSPTSGAAPKTDTT